MNVIKTDFSDNLVLSNLKVRAINHDLRKSILDLLAENQELKVTDIYVKMRLEQSVASQHLSILRKQGYVKTKRVGKEIYYSVNFAELKRVEKVLLELTK